MSSPERAILEALNELPAHAGFHNLDMVFEGLAILKSAPPDGTATKLSKDQGVPNLDAIGLPQATALPAVHWKLLSLRRLAAENSEKRAAQRAELEQIIAWSITKLERSWRFDSPGASPREAVIEFNSLVGKCGGTE